MSRRLLLPVLGLISSLVSFFSFASFTAIVPIPIPGLLFGLILAIYYGRNRSKIRNLLFILGSGIAFFVAQMIIDTVANENTVFGPLPNKAFTNLDFAAAGFFGTLLLLISFWFFIGKIKFISFIILLTLGTLLGFGGVDPNKILINKISVDDLSGNTSFLFIFWQTGMATAFSILEPWRDEREKNSIPRRVLIILILLLILLGLFAFGMI